MAATKRAREGRSPSPVYDDTQEEKKKPLREEGKTYVLWFTHNEDGSLDVYLIPKSRFGHHAFPDLEDFIDDVVGNGANTDQLLCKLTDHEKCSECGASACTDLIEEFHVKNQLFEPVLGDLVVTSPTWE